MLLLGRALPVREGLGVRRGELGAGGRGKPVPLDYTDLSTVFLGRL